MIFTGWTQLSTNVWKCCDKCIIMLDLLFIINGNNCFQFQSRNGGQFCWYNLRFSYHQGTINSQYVHSWVIGRNNKRIPLGWHLRNDVTQSLRFLQKQWVTTFMVW